MEPDLIPLNEFITLQRGFDLPKSDRKHGEVPVVASTGIGGFHNEFKVQGPGVVIGRSGSIGGGQYIKEDFWPLNTTLWVKDYKGHNTRYIYYLLKSIDFSIFNVGSGVPTLNRNHLSSLKVPSLSRDLENQIAKTLGNLDDRIKINQHINQSLEKMAQALFKSWFVNFDPVVDKALAAGNSIPDELAFRVEIRKKAHAMSDFQPLPENIRNLFPSKFEYTGEATVGIGGWVPEGWSVKKLSDLLCVRYGKDHKKLDEGEYPVYGSGGLMRRVDKFLHEGESVLIPRKGTLSNIMYVNEAFWSVDTMFFTIPKMPNVAKFSYFLLKRLNFDSMNVGSAVPSMTTKVLNSLQIVYPTEFILAKFDEILGPYFSKERFNQDNTKQLERIRDTLLPKLISGAISINKEVE